MEFYSWKTCPEQYKALAPFTKHFFDTGEVLMIGVVKRAGEDKALVTYVLDQIRTSYTDLVATNEVRIMFWTREHGRILPKDEIKS